MSRRGRRPSRATSADDVVVAALARELRGLGHRPTVFAADDARRDADARPRRGGPPDRFADLRHAGVAWARIAEGEAFDVVHVHHPEAVPFSGLVPVPTVATVHHDRVDALAEHYAAYPEVAFVAASRRQTELAWEVPFRAVIHHGLDVARHPLGRGGRRCAFIGRPSPDGAPHLAIRAARRARRPIVLAGDAGRLAGDYFEREIGPRLGGGVSWIGALDASERRALLATSWCLLCPLQWEEPFGLVMIEAMLLGTPVVAFACGGAPEIVEDGVTGFVVHTVDEMSRRVRDVGDVDRKACRARARARWSSARMARAYVALYREVIESWRGARAPRVGRARAALAAVARG